MAGMLQRNMDLAEAVWGEIPLESRRKPVLASAVLAGRGRNHSKAKCPRRERQVSGMKVKLTHVNHAGPCGEAQQPAILKRQSPAKWPGFRLSQSRRVDSWTYFATRRWESPVAIWSNTVTISPDDVSRKNLLASLAQFFSIVEVGSPSVLTCMV